MSLEALPRGLREPVEVAYLLARTADTIADTDAVAAPAREATLRELLGGVNSAAAGAAPEAPGGVALLLARLAALPAADRRDAGDVVARLVGTMRWELAQFRGGPGEIVALPDEAALVGYTEGIAGCVGEFWARIVARHARGTTPHAAWLSEARRYGRGLQLVNILRDLPRDLRRGRCFLPRPELAAAGLVPADLLEPAALARLAPILARWERRARFGLLAGLAYATHLPVWAWRVRVATVLPAALGLPTLRRVARDPRRLDPGTVVRIGRGEVRRILAATAFWCAFPAGPARLARGG
ncbi:MAG: squalene/phytoene synthase family protein [Acidobacteria bacterium]|nr:squalene/phytoene synthase family protein [Acidobacteriota bacterium]